jgi:hypothetical protein
MFHVFSTNLIKFTARKLKITDNLGLREYETLRRGLHSVHPSCRQLRARIGVGGFK